MRTRARAVDMQGRLACVRRAAGNLTALTTFSINSNAVSGALPAAMGGMTALTWFSAPNNQLSGTIPHELGALRALSYLNLNDNAFTSTVPAAVISLTSLTWLGLGGNALSGTLADTFAGAAALTTLNVAYNALSVRKRAGEDGDAIACDGGSCAQGTLPPSLFGVKSLQWLGLDDNQFAGTVPSSLSNLTALQYLCAHAHARQARQSVTCGAAEILGATSCPVASLRASWACRALPFCRCNTTASTRPRRRSKHSALTSGASAFWSRRAGPDVAAGRAC